MTYDVLLTKKGDKFMARVCQWPAIVAESNTEEGALRKAKDILQSLLAGGRIVQLKVDIKPEEHPWQQFAGMFTDDPDWEALQASTREYREAIDRDSCEDWMFILDTDHVSLFQRNDPHVSARVLETPPQELATAVITVEEQLRGRFRSNSPCSKR